MANFVLGKSGKVYISGTPLESTSSATPLSSATEVTNVQDVTTNMTKDVVEINSRANNGWKQKVGTLKDASVSTKILYKPADANFTLLQGAYLDDDEVALWVLDGAKATTGSQGVAGNFMVANFSRNEPIGDVMTVDVELVPSSYTHWHTVAGAVMGVVPDAPDVEPESFAPVIEMKPEPKKVGSVK